MVHHQSLGWQPQNTWVFVVGLLEWKDEDMWSSFPQENRRDAMLVEFFGASGVPEGQITYLQDRQATTRRIQEQLDVQLPKAGPNDLLVLYYCGHGWRKDDGSAYFASYDADAEDNPGWSMDSLPKVIEQRFSGSRALLLADCCHSGCLAEVCAASNGRVAFACLASSLASELSTGNWTFTETLLAGLSGHAFVDTDGSDQITLRELADQIVESMAFAEEQIARFATSPRFDADIVLAGARPRPDPRVGQRVAARSGDTWYRAHIVDVRDGGVKVHYYGYEESDDEWLGVDQVRTVARPAYPVGAAVQVQWKQRWFPATVLDARFGIHHITYEGFGPEWNEWVALKRIRPLV
ncbi:MAG TPA: hypothetical protein VFS21_26250 [Roseiflexaceae bacterium]|nr:hypothetical protein [Roseiflexaceae bacterium]